VRFADSAWFASITAQYFGESWNSPESPAKGRSPPAAIKARRERTAARRHIESGQPLMVSKSVDLEFTGLLQGSYGFDQADVASVIRHLLRQGHIAIEERESVHQALSNAEAGVDFADALHHASYRACDGIATFDDRRFAPCGKRLPLVPNVKVLA
jgi:predicted nucleic-acid-binding protein